MNKTIGKDHRPRRALSRISWLFPNPLSTSFDISSPSINSQQSIAPEGSMLVNSKPRHIFSRRHWTKSSSSSVYESDKPKSFRREIHRTKDNELKMLHYSFVMAESALLREAVRLAYTLTETTQTGPTAQDCVHLVEKASAYIMTVVNYRQTVGTDWLDLDIIMNELVNALREIQKKIYALPEILEPKTVDDWKREKVVTDQCKFDLEEAISRSQENYPILASQHGEIPSASQDIITRKSWSPVSSILGTSIVLLKILKEAAEIAPVPFLKGSIGTILVLLQTAETTRINREDILQVANMAEDFIASIWEACQGSNEALSGQFQSAVDSLSAVLLDILKKSQAFSERSLLYRVISQNSDRNEITACKQQLQNAVSKFQVTTHVLQQYVLDEILAGQKEVMESIHASLLETLPHAPVSFEKGDYVTATRTEVLETISDWIENPANGGQVFWLHGAAGMGKSTITRRLRAVLGEGGRLAGHFFFQRQSKEQERPDFIIGTLAYQLAHFQRSMKLAVVDAIEHPSVDQLFSTRFKTLILDPLIKGEFALPTVILLDALDEYKDASELLDVLVALISRFPPNIKIFITSRPEFYIESRMRKLGAHQCELRSASAEAIELIIKDRLQNIDGWKQFPTAEKISQLVKLADGLPIWAATACTFIAKFRPGYPDHLFNQLLVSQSAYRRAAEGALDALYHTALEHIYPPVSRGPDLQAEEFRRIFGCVYVVKDPLTVTDIEMLLGEDNSVEPLMATLSILHTRASSSLGRETLITPVSERFHASFIDFIVDTQRCTDARFRLDIIEIHDNLARLCFRLMEELFGSVNRSCESYASLSNAHRYAVDNWAAHASHTKTLSAALRATLSNFTLRHFSAWFQTQFESITGLPMSPEIKKAYDLQVYSDPPADRLSHLATLTLYAQQMGHPVDIIRLNRAILVQSLALNMAGDNDPKHLTIYGSLFMNRFKRSEKVEDVENAIQHYRSAFAVCPPSSIHRSRLLYYLAVALLARAEKCRSEGDLDEATQCFSESLETLTPELATNLVRTFLLSGRANVCSLRFRMSKHTSHLIEAISLHREALSLAQQGNCARAEFLGDLADSLEFLYGQSGSLNDLNEVIALRQEALRLLHEIHEDRNNLLSNIASALQAALSESSDHVDMYDILPLCRDVLAMNSHSKGTLLRNLAICLQARFDRHGKLDDLDECILRLREVIEIFTAGHPDRADSLDDLAVALQSRYSQVDKVEHLDEAISLYKQALALCPPGHSERPRYLTNLGTGLRTRYADFGRVEDLDEAILLQQQVLELCPRGHPNRAASLNNLGNALLTRSQTFGRLDDLHEAILLHRQALEFRPPGHEHRTDSLNNLGLALQIRFEQSSQVEDLDEAISLHRQVLKIWPSGHPDHAMSLNNLGTALQARFVQFGQTKDLDEAIVLHKQALECRPPGHPDHADSLNNLGVVLQARFVQSGVVDDLHEAISLHRHALQLRPPSHPDRALSLNQLGLALQAQYDKFGRAEDLAEATSLLRQAREHLPPSHPEHLEISED